MPRPTAGQTAHTFRRRVAKSASPPLTVTSSSSAVSPRRRSAGAARVRRSFRSLATAVGLPRGLNHAAVAAFAGRVFVFGGFAQEDGRPLSDAYAYDPAADTWSSLASLPSPRGAAAATTFGHGIHVVGGNSAGSIARHDRYDPEKNVWETRAPLPVGRDHLAAVTAQGTLFAIAGRIGSFRHNVSRTDAYDPARDAWTSKAPLPTARSGVAAALYRDRIVVCGGESPSRAFATVEAYDPQSDAWSILPSLPAARHGTGAVVLDDVVFVPGGAPRPGGSQSDTLFALST